ncbi:DDE-type integrase/transposase/recombinase, partial [Roseobacter sinensis]
MRPTHPDHVWTIGFGHDKLSNGRGHKMLTVLDGFTRQALAAKVRTRMGAGDVLEARDPFLLRHGSPEYIGSDNGPGFTAEARQDRLRRVGIKPPHLSRLTPGERLQRALHGTLRREALNPEWVTTTKQAQIVINRWLKQYNHTRLHPALNMRPHVPKPPSEKPTISGQDKKGRA